MERGEKGKEGRGKGRKHCPRCEPYIFGFPFTIFEGRKKREVGTRQWPRWTLCALQLHERKKEEERGKEGEYELAERHLNQASAIFFRKGRKKGKGEKGKKGTEEVRGQPTSIDLSEALLDPQGGEKRGREEGEFCFC